MCKLFDFDDVEFYVMSKLEQWRKRNTAGLRAATSPVQRQLVASVTAGCSARIAVNLCDVRPL